MTTEVSKFRNLTLAILAAAFLNACTTTQFGAEPSATQVVVVNTRPPLDPPLEPTWTAQPPADPPTIQPMPDTSPTPIPVPTAESSSPEPEVSTRELIPYELYRHPDQGFGLILQNEAEIFPTVQEETNRGVTIVFSFVDTNYILAINARPAGTSNPIGPALPGPVEPIIRNEDRDIIFILDQPLSRQVYLEEDRLKGVDYIHSDGDQVFGAGPIELSLSLRAANPDYAAIDIPAEATALADKIVSSLWISGPRTAQRIERPAPDSAELWSSATFTSPDGLWTAETYSFNPNPELNEHQQLFVLSDPSSTFELINETEGWGLGVGQYEPLRWTGDALYFTYAPVPDGCGNGTNSSDLWRFTFNSQTVEQIAPGLLFTSDVSADGRYWAGMRGDELWVIDFEKNLINRWEVATALRRGRVTHLSFNPSGNALLLVTADSTCAELGEKNVYRFDNQLEEVILVDTIEAQHPVVAEWVSNDHVILEDLLGEGRFEVELVP